MINTSILTKKRHNSRQIGVIIVFFFVVQILFLHADPDSIIGRSSRDAFTDEGMYSEQIRYFLRTGNWHFFSDALVKSVGWTAWLTPFIAAFGHSLWAARIATLVASALILLYLQRVSDRFNALFLPFFILVFLQFYVFQYAHYALAELPAVLCGLAATVLLIDGLADDIKPVSSVVSSVIWCFLAVLLKFQYVYLMALPTVSIIFIIIYKLLTSKYLDKKKLQLFFAILATTIGATLIYVLAVYLPFRAEIDSVFSWQTQLRLQGGSAGSAYRAPAPQSFWAVLIWGKRVNYYFLLYAVAIIFLLRKIILDYKKNKFFDDSSALLPILISMIWVGLESHKLLLVYMPYRYLLGLFVAVGFSILLIINYLNINKKIFYGLLCATGVLHSTLIIQAVNRRDYGIERANAYFTQTYKNETTPIIGAWGASLVRRSAAPVVPVWTGWRNTEVISRHAPRLILVDSLEDGLLTQLRAEGISDLEAASDSSRTFSLGNGAWTVRAYWLKSQKPK